MFIRFIKIALTISILISVVGQLKNAMNNIATHVDNRIATARIEAGL
jgi:hypothetical protein